MKIKIIGYVIASLPAVGVLTLFYSLAVHMHRALGGWPTYIGTSGFPPALRMHSEAADFAFGLFFQTLFLLPLPLIACVFVPRWQRFAPYWVAYGVSILVCVLLMLFAPPAFLTWWQD